MIMQRTNTIVFIISSAILLFLCIMPVFSQDLATPERMNVDFDLSSRASVPEFQEFGFSTSIPGDFNSSVDNISDFDITLTEDGFARYEYENLYAWWKVVSGSEFSIELYLTDRLISLGSGIDWSVSWDNEIDGFSSIGKDEGYGEAFGKELYRRENVSTLGSFGYEELTVNVDFPGNIIPGDYTGTLVMKLSVI